MAIDAAIYVANRVVELRTNEIIQNGTSKYSVDFYSTHKLLYYAQGIMLAKYGKKLFIENIYAHTCGPWVSGLDAFFDKVEDRDITSEIKGGILPTPDRREILEYVARVYGCQDRDTLIFKTKKHDIYIETLDREQKGAINNEELKAFFITNKDELYPDLI